jgi:hypothetical protein
MTTERRRERERERKGNERGGEWEFVSLLIRTAQDVAGVWRRGVMKVNERMDEHDRSLTIFAIQRKKKE